LQNFLHLTSTLYTSQDTYMFLQNKFTLATLGILSIFTLSLAVFISVSVPAESRENQYLASVENSSQNSNNSSVNSSISNSIQSSSVSTTSQQVVSDIATNKIENNAVSSSASQTNDVVLICDTANYGRICQIKNSKNKVLNQLEWTNYTIPEISKVENGNYYIASSGWCDGSFFSETCVINLETWLYNAGNNKVTKTYDRSLPIAFYMNKILVFDNECSKQYTTLSGSFNNCYTKDRSSQSNFPIYDDTKEFLDNWKFYTGKEL